MACRAVGAVVRTPAAIKLTDVIATYRRVPAVHHVNGTFAPRSLTAIAGPNGAGKSTLLKAVMGLIPLSDGTIDRGGLAPERIAYLPQVAEIDRSFPVSVLTTVVLGAWPRAGMFGAVDAAEVARARACIAQVGLTGYEEASIAALSAGQWQRVLFARLILQDAAVILLDEPFAAVDERTTADLMALVQGWHQEGRTVAAVLHDVAFIRKHFPETLLLARELVAWGPTAEALSDANIERARRMTDRWARDEVPTHTHEHAH